MSVMLLNLRQRNPVAFAAVMAKGKELRDLQQSKGDHTEPVKRGQIQVDERLRLQEEWNRASSAQYQNGDQNDQENWDLAMMALMTLLPSQPHPEV